MNDLNVYPGQKVNWLFQLDYSAYEGKLDSVAGNVIKFKATLMTENSEYRLGLCLCCCL